MSRSVVWSTPQEVLPAEGRWAELDVAGASGPCVLESDDGDDRLWYAGRDGSTERILAAVRAPDGHWERLGLAVDAGAAGDSDSYGVGSPSVVRSPGGYCMVYAGSDGADTRLHMATSTDGLHWDAKGTFMSRGEHDAVGATHPCVVVGNHWWLFYAGYDGTENGRRARILTAVSDNGDSWDRFGTIMVPQSGELAVCEPWVVRAFGSFDMFYVSDDDRRPVIALATSTDGLSWSRRGTVIAGTQENTRGVRSPCVVRGGGGLRLWYSASRSSSPDDTDRLWMVETDRSGL